MTQKLKKGIIDVIAQAMRINMRYRTTYHPSFNENQALFQKPDYLLIGNNRNLSIDETSIQIQTKT